jgi:hypothetical protein
MMMMTIDRSWTWPSADLPRTEIVMQYNGNNLDMALRGPVPIVTVTWTWPSADPPRGWTWPSSVEDPPSEMSPKE